MSPLFAVAVAVTLTVIAAAVGLARRDAAYYDAALGGVEQWEPPVEDADESRGLRLIQDDANVEDGAA